MMSHLLLFVVLIFRVNATTYHVAVDLPLSDPGGSIPPVYFSRPFFEFMFADVNARIMAPLGDIIIPHYLDNPESSTSLTFQYGVEISNICNSTGYDIMAVIGPDFSSDVELTAQYLSNFNLLLVTWEATADVLSDKSQYPNVVRVTITDSYESYVLAHLVKQLGWSRVGILAENNAYGNGLTQSFATICAQIGIVVVASQPFQTSQPSTITQAFNVLKAADARIIAVFANDITGVFDIATELGMTTPDYVYLATDGSIPTEPFPLGSLGTNIWVNQSMPTVAALIEHLLQLPNVTLGADNWFPSEYEPHQDDAVRLVAYTLAKFSRLNVACQQATPTTFCQLYQETCMLYNTTDICLALQEGCQTSTATICTQLDTLSSRRQIITQLAFQTPFNGTTGYVAVDLNGNRAAPCAIVNQVQSVVGTQNGTSLAQIGSMDTNFQFEITTPITWPGYAAQPPLDRRGVRPGTVIQPHFNGLMVILSLAVAIAAAWVGVILFANIIPAYIESNYRSAISWLVATTFVLTIAVWAAMVIGLTALEFPDLPDGISLTYASSYVMTAVLVPWMPIGMGLIVALRPLIHKRVTPLSIMHASTKAFTEVKFKLTYVFLGSAIATLGLIGCVYLMMAGLVAPCQWQLLPGYQVAMVVVSFICVTLTVLLLLWAKRPLSRALSAVTMTATQFIVFSGTQFTYTGVLLSPQTPALTLQLVGVSVAIISAFILMILNVTQLKLSRDALDAHLIMVRRELNTVTQTRDKLSHEVERYQREFQLLHILSPKLTVNHPLMQSLMKEIREAKAYEPEFLTTSSWEPKTTLKMTDFLKNPLTFELIKMKLMDRQCAESAYFLGDLYQWRHAYGEEKQALHEHILQTYIKEDSPLEINIPAVMRANALKKHGDFKEIEAELARLIAANGFNDIKLVCAVILEWMHFSKQMQPGPTSIESKTRTESRRE
jgi:ABC-type branched-subunit amino acid transport system substrate-binding protein